MLFLNFSTEQFDSFKSKYLEVAQLYKGKDLSFLMGDIEASQGAFQVRIQQHHVLHSCIEMILLTCWLFCSLEQYFGLKEDQIPLIIIQTNDGAKYLKPNVDPDQISSWVKEFKVMLRSLLGLIFPLFPFIRQMPPNYIMIDMSVLKDILTNDSRNR